MASPNAFLDKSQARSVLLAYLASDNANGYLQMTFTHQEDGYIEIKETKDYDIIITRVSFGVEDVELFEVIEDFVKAYGLETHLILYREFIVTS